jgi:membrane dipeptidase
MPSAGLLARAEALHRSYPVVECHTDVPVDVYRRRRSGEASPYCDDYVPRMRAGGVRIQLLAVGGDVPDQHEVEGSPGAAARAMIADVLDEEGRCSRFRVVRAASDLDAAVQDDQVGFVLHLEGLTSLGGDPEALAGFYELGVRSAQLTWNGRNELASGVGAEQPGGLTPAGREVVAELDRLGMLVDVAHLAEPSFWDLFEVARGPIIASHANMKALCPHRRNLTDDQIRAIAEAGGVVGVCFIADFIGRPATLARLVDHVDHLAGLVGVESIAVGPDYVEFAPDLMVDPRQGDSYLGPEGLRRVETLPVFTAGLLERGYSEEDAAAILGGNMLRVLRTVLSRAG